MNSFVKTKVRSKYSCPGCKNKAVTIFYKVKGVPIHSVLLLRSRDEALNYPRGDIELGFCENCGFISNTAFDPSLHEYYAEYESSQAFSETFNSFSKNLAELLIERHDLRNKSIVEIGCGQGEFLKLLCSLGDNEGIGFDPAYNESRSSDGLIEPNGYHGKVSFIKDFYSEKYSDCSADFICCKMTLEHIQDTANFINTVRKSIGERKNTVVFFQIPETTRILDDVAFWDIYYEHCSYFSPISLAKLFQINGFDVTDIWTDYDDQYLMIEAAPGKGEMKFDFDCTQELNKLSDKLNYFVNNYQKKLDEWKTKLKSIKEGNLKAVIWGSSSKGVAFLTTLDINCNDIQYVVDVNPFRQGSYMAGTGQKIVSPSFLREHRPDLAIVMNPIYSLEIRKNLDELQLSTETITV